LVKQTTASLKPPPAFSLFQHIQTLTHDILRISPNKNIDSLFSFIWIPGHTDDIPEQKQSDSSINCDDNEETGSIGNKIADFLADKAALDSFNLQPSDHVLAFAKIPLSKAKQCIKKRTKILWRTSLTQHYFRLSREKKQNRTCIYLKNYIYWTGTTMNWAHRNESYRPFCSQETRWRSPPPSLVNRKSRTEEIAIARIRLNYTYTADNLHIWNNFFTQVSDKVCPYPSCNQPDSTHHRLFSCKTPKIFNARLAIAQRLGKALQLPRAKPSRTILKSHFNWRLLLNHDFREAPHVTSRFFVWIDPVVAIELADIFFCFLKQSGLLHFFANFTPPISSQILSP
jgi:hypothetical protein